MTNREHLQSLRANTCYPSFRTFIAFFVVLGHMIALIEALVGIFGIYRENIFIICGGIVGSVLTVVMVKVGAEMILMISDIADCIINSSKEKGNGL